MLYYIILYYIILYYIILYYIILYYIILYYIINTIIPTLGKVFLEKPVDRSTCSAVPVCPMPSIVNTRSNSSNCITSEKCPVGTTLQYSCESGFVLSSPTTKCLDDHTWTNAPTCVKGDKRYYNWCFSIQLLIISLNNNNTHGTMIQKRCLKVNIETTIRVFVYTCIIVML